MTWSIFKMKMLQEPNGARLRRSDGGVNPAGRNTGPGWQIFSNNKTL